MLCRWHAHPGLTPSARRLLHLKGAGRAEVTTTPSLLHPDLAPAGSQPYTDPTKDGKLQWSEAFDAMSAAAHLAVVEIAAGIHAYVAVSISPVR